MKRTLLMLCSIFTMLCLLAGCGSTSSSSQNLPPPGGGAPAGVAPPPASDITSVPGSAAVSSSSSDISDSSAGSSVSSSGEETLNSVTGIIDSAGIGKFYVEMENGQVIPFLFQEADLSGLEDSRPGSPITVYFTGTLNGTDTSGITVVRMETPTQ